MKHDTYCKSLQERLGTLSWCQVSQKTRF